MNTHPQLLQQQMLQQQAAARQRSVLMQQQYSGGMPNGMPMNIHGMNPNQMNAQFAMRHNTPGLARPVNLPQHLAQQQQIAQDNVNQQAHQQVNSIYEWLNFMY